MEHVSLPALWWVLQPVELAALWEWQPLGQRCAAHAHTPAAPVQGSQSQSTSATCSLMHSPPIHTMPTGAPVPAVCAGVLVMAH